ncbi:MAG: hypothetical protein KF729_12640 [Sandaracinaceae bacterium]|nr:hypothetical protein [Sandaracinaceae bacterium]
MSARIALDLGPRALERLLAQRPPLLLVDRVEWLEPGPRPRVRCARAIGADEPVFAGHFPGAPLWPGAYTIEGLGQAANLLSALDALVERAGDAAALAAALRALDAGAPSAAGAPWLEAPPPVGMSAAVDVKLLEPVYPGVTIAYEARRTHAVADAARFAVEAWVDGRPVARGSITGSTRVPARSGGR